MHPKMVYINTSRVFFGLLTSYLDLNVDFSQTHITPVTILIAVSSLYLFAYGDN